MIVAALLLAGASPSINDLPMAELIATCENVSMVEGAAWLDMLRTVSSERGWSDADADTLVRTCGVYAGGKLSVAKVALADARRSLDQNSMAGRLAIENIDLKQRLQTCLNR